MIKKAACQLDSKLFFFKQDANTRILPTKTLSSLLIQLTAQKVIMCPIFVLKMLQKIPLNKYDQKVKSELYKN